MCFPSANPVNIQRRDGDKKQSVMQNLASANFSQQRN